MPLKLSALPKLPKLPDSSRTDAVLSGILSAGILLLTLLLNRKHLDFQSNIPVLSLDLLLAASFCFFICRVMLKAFRSHSFFRVLLAVFCWGVLFSMPVLISYSGNDTDWVYSFTHETWKEQCASGRPFCGILLDTVISFGMLRPAVINTVSLLSILFLSMSLTLLHDQLCRAAGSDAPFRRHMVCAGLCLLVWNPFSMEFLGFNNYIFCHYFFLGVIILALYMPLRFRNRRGIAGSLVLLCMSGCGYQPSLAVYALLGPPVFCFAFPSTGKSGWRSRLGAAVLPGIFSGTALCFSALSMHLLVRLLNLQLGVRTSGKADIAANLQTLYEQLPHYCRDSFGFFPDYGLFFITLCLLILFLLNLRNLRWGAGETLGIALISAIGLWVYSIGFQILLPAPNYYAARSVFACAGVPGFLLMLLFLLKKDFRTESPRFQQTAWALLALFACILLYHTHKMSAVLHERDGQDRIIGEQIFRQIEKLEAQHKNRVTELMICRDAVWRETYPEADRNYGFWAAKLFSVPWKLELYFPAFHNRNFKIDFRIWRPQDEEVRKIVRGRNWDRLSAEEQVVWLGGGRCAVISY